MLLLSGAVASLSGGCGQAPPPAPISLEEEYTNNQYLASAGYYHAPYYSWYPQPYNNYDPQFGYYYGGLWHPTQEVSTVTRSRPSAQAIAKVARSLSRVASTSTERHGFGRSRSFKSSGT